MLSLDYIMDNTIWVAKMASAPSVDKLRIIGPYKEVKDKGYSDECIDFDVCAKQEEPELQEFWDALWEYESSHGGFITIQEFYPIWKEEYE